MAVTTFTVGMSDFSGCGSSGFGPVPLLSVNLDEAPQAAMTAERETTRAISRTERRPGHRTRLGMSANPCCSQSKTCASSADAQLPGRRTTVADGLEDN